MSKTVDIDLSGDRLIGIAADLVEDHNYIGALKMLNKNAETEGNDVDAYMLYAEIFDDMGLYEKSINGWFKFMDVADEDDFSDCYEGLAVDYMNIGNEHFSAYYYNKLMFTGEEIDGEMREEIVKDFLFNDVNPLKFAWPPALADCSDIMSAGIEKMRGGDYDAAADEFGKVDEGNSRYGEARNYIAMCRIIADKTEEAEQECLNLLKKRPDDVQALTTLAAVKTEAGKQEEALELAKKLLSLQPDDSDEIYKIATVCCENKLHAEAYRLFCMLDEDFANDLTVMYFKAVAAFNSGKFDECFSVFDRLLTIYPEAVTARFYYNAARAMKDSGEITELGYFYRLPQEVRESSLKMLTAYMRLNKDAAKKLAGEIDLSSLIRWCLDEGEGKGFELQYLAGEVAVKAGLYDLLRDVLLNAFLPDQLKINLLTTLAERNEFDCFGVVICNVYRRVTMQHIRLGRNKRKYFISAYARLVAHFSILDDEHGRSFAAAAEEIYSVLEGENRLDDAKDADALTAAVYILSGVKEAGIERANVCSFFDITEERLNKILGGI